MSEVHWSTVLWYETNLGDETAVQSFQLDSVFNAKKADSLNP